VSPETYSPTACRAPHDHGDAIARLIGSRDFPGIPEAIAETRDFLRTLLPNSPVIDNALLLTSEVATNAIRHSRSAGRTFTLVILDIGHAIRIEVVDDGAPTAPQVIDDIDAIAGRGMLLVASIATQWGTWSDEAGRTTWFELSPSPR
jgi:anti-sigma regulatory factor (Ser/Thr protein kinase)